ncbi:integrase [Caudoviricetes sp.]|nr:integrase [Caudoviricetes sp.]
MFRDTKTQIWYTRIGGKKCSLGTRKKEMAQKLETKLKADFLMGRYGIVSGKRITIREIGECYKNASVGKTPEKTEAKRKQINFYLESFVYPHFAEREVVRLTRGDVSEWAKHLGIKYKPDTVNRIITVFRAAIKWAMLSEKFGDYIPKDPVGKWPMQKVGEHTTTFMTTDEIALVLNHEDKMAVAYRPMITFALFTGLRISNIIGCKWDWVDFNANILTVPHESAKSGQQMRLPLRPEVVEVLRKQEGLHDTYVFANPRTNKPFTRNGLSHAWQKVLKRVGIKRRIRFHDVRHTFASYLAMNGTPLDVIGDLLGHSSTSQTKRYRHYSPEFLADRMATLAYGQNTDTDKAKH